MFKNILLPLDLTDKHQAAFDLAVKLARESGGTLVLLHVIEVIAGLPVEEEQTFYQRLERMARKHLERFGAALAEHQVPVRGEIRFGSRPQEIAREAADIGADLIIVTSPRLNPQQPGAALGSLSYKIGLLAQCPVLLVKV